MGGGARQGVKISEIGAQILKIGAREMFFWGKPVGIQSGSTRDAVGHQCREAAKFIENRVLARFWMILAASRQVQKWCQKLQNWCLTASRKNALPHHLRPYFPLRPTLAPIFLFRAPAMHQPLPLLHQNGKSSLEPNGGSMFVQDLGLHFMAEQDLLIDGWHSPHYSRITWTISWPSM